MQAVSILPKDVIRLVDNLKPISPYAIEIINQAENEEVSLLDIARKVSLDPNLSAKLLKACSSPIIGKKIDSPFHAVLTLGMKRVIELVISSSIRGSISKSLTTFDYDLWEHNLSIAFSIQAIIRETHANISLARGFTAGLLHDIGKNVLIQLNPAGASVYEQISFDCNQEVIERETKKYGVSHVDVAKYLLKVWNLPEEISFAIITHHNPLENQTELAKLIYFSHKIQKYPEVDESELELIQNHLRLDISQIERIKESTRYELEAISLLFD